jgi:hypothetical protein
VNCDQSLRFWPALVSFVQNFPWRPLPALQRAYRSSLPWQGDINSPNSTPTRRRTTLLHSALFLRAEKIRRTDTYGGSSSVALASGKGPTLAVYQVSSVYLTSPPVISFVKNSLPLVHFLPRFSSSSSFEFSFCFTFSLALVHCYIKIWVYNNDSL